MVEIGRMGGLGEGALKSHPVPSNWKERAIIWDFRHLPLNARTAARLHRATSAIKAFSRRFCFQLNLDLPHPIPFHPKPRAYEIGTWEVVLKSLPA